MNKDSYTFYRKDGRVHVHGVVDGESLMFIIGLLQGEKRNEHGKELEKNINNIITGSLHTSFPIMGKLK